MGISVYISKPESTSGKHARNVEVQASQGSYLAFLDDEWLDTKIEKQVSILRYNPQIGMFYCRKILAYDSGNMEEWNLNLALSGDVKEKAWTRVPFLTSCLMLYKELFQRVGYFDEELRFWQGYALGIRLTKCSELGFVHKNLVLYRINLLDKYRFTNKVYEWENAVEYFERKHADLFAELPAEM